MPEAMTRPPSKTDASVEALFQEAARLAAETIRRYTDRDERVVHRVDPRLEGKQPREPARDAIRLGRVREHDLAVRVDACSQRS